MSFHEGSCAGVVEHQIKAVIEVTLSSLLDVECWLKIGAYFNFYLCVTLRAVNDIGIDSMMKE